MHVAQIAQHGLIFFAHATRKIRVIQMLVPRRFRHVLQHTQSLPDRFLPIRRHLFPVRQNIVLDVGLLLGCQFSPVLLRILDFLLFLWRQPVEFLLILQHLLLLLRSQILEAPCIRLWIAGIRRTVRIAIHLPVLATGIRRTIHVWIRVP